MNALTSARVDAPAVPTPLPIPTDLADRVRARGGYGADLWCEAAVVCVAALLYKWRAHRPDQQSRPGEIDAALFESMERIVREQFSGVHENWTSVLLGRLPGLKVGVLCLPVVGIEPGRPQAEGLPQAGGLEAQCLAERTLAWVQLVAAYEAAGDLANAVACGACALYIEFSPPSGRDSADDLADRRELALGAAGCCRLSRARQTALRRRLGNLLYPS